MIRRLVERSGIAAISVALLAGLALPAGAAADLENDYPTEARADYVFGCMAANGQTRESLQRCSCSLDALASILPYDKYVQASTILSMRQGVGQRANEFKSTKVFDDKIADLKRAQAEAEIRCFRG
ncbi:MULTISPECIES: hypothetical protein [Methylobacterium]|uniref:Secreted protein n=1 Tax=Methylobacterium jeotgali TaxID=381630 RepID=A0ABQ4SR20_9HYPH|nr:MULTISPECIES: hypothetical protein [Methylobacterium]PIU07834.1 MAG: hypothetical protein COT56_03525 [Methylobacterium sp. CG09_land_8_20_14_0_10_71_15]PIU13135.1 MAG: hypothetical protein COT28_12520 [Methylobacterium sp. CG08_land_8_20_14_0_20_71_15]GBU15993.1 hypothetical protein AwMethylo_02080 [Methylobacterium sp.]GJE05625.1 hypothetical protein AOPFMNJM_0928 [Methylobacterium jeotgali]